MAVESVDNSKFSKLLKSRRYEIECHQCGGKLSINISQDEKKHNCPFCEESKNNDSLLKSHSYELPVESPVLRFPSSFPRF